MTLRIYAMYERKAAVIFAVCVFGLYSIATLTVSHTIYTYCMWSH